MKTRLNDIHEVLTARIEAIFDHPRQGESLENGMLPEKFFQHAALARSRAKRFARRSWARSTSALARQNGSAPGIVNRPITVQVAGRRLELRRRT